MQSLIIHYQYIQLLHEFLFTIFILLFRAGIFAIIIVGVCFFGYAVFFNHNSNSFRQQIKDAEVIKAQRLEKATGYLKEENFPDHLLSLTR